MKIALTGGSGSIGRAIIERALESARLRRENQELRVRVGGDLDLIGNSAAIQQLRQAIDRVAPTLLYMVSHLSGDQTGKTLLAGGGWVGEVRFEVHDGYEPSDDFTAEELARAVADGKVLFPDRDAKWVTAYGPSGKREG